MGRTSPRFVIANKNRIAGASIRWTIRPGTEAQPRRSFSDPPPAEPQFPRSYGGLSQLIHCVLCNRRFDRHESVARHQREAHPAEPQFPRSYGGLSQLIAKQIKIPRLG